VCWLLTIKHYRKRFRANFARLLFQPPHPTAFDFPHVFRFTATSTASQAAHECKRWCGSSSAQSLKVRALLAPLTFFVILRAVMTDRDSTASNARENGIPGRTVWTSAHSEPYRDVRQFQKLSQPVRLCDGPGRARPTHDMFPPPVTRGQTRSG